MTDPEPVPVWYDRSADVIGQFDGAARPRRILGLIPSTVPLYDWIMGYHERPSNRAALTGPLDPAHRVIADVGCGTGHLLGLVVARTRASAARVLAVDLSQVMLERARGHLEAAGLMTPQVTFCRADCRDLPLSDGACDLYVSSYLLDMLPEAELAAALEEMVRVLRPGGQAVLMTMTLEADGLPGWKRALFHAANALYNAGYRNGRWNRIWRFFCDGYAPHCRPIALGPALRAHPGLRVEYTALSRVTLFPVRIWYLRKADD